MAVLFISLEYQDQISGAHFKTKGSLITYCENVMKTLLIQGLNDV